MDRAPLFALALLSLVGGCLEGSPDAAGTPTADGNADLGRMARGLDEDGTGHFDGSFDLMVNPDGLVPVNVGGTTQGNCVLFWDTGGADYVLRNGTATLEWDALTPLAEDLRISAVGATGEPFVTGPSPLVLPIAELTNEHEWGLGFAADAPLGSLAVQQAVALTLSFDREGDLPQPGFGSCSNGIL